ASSGDRSQVPDRPAERAPCPELNRIGGAGPRAPKRAAASVCADRSGLEQPPVPAGHRARSAGSSIARAVGAWRSRAQRMKRVLLVDDEPSILVALRSLVERRGWEALVASSGIEALALLDGTGGRPDAVVTDFSMPGMDGLELLAAIRRRDRHLPV